ncbi:MAG: hypothetical protein HWE35_14665 [Rhodobacteraceae bacterium]|nr:hypothetical protein [Paracoccaceae bacterium]
MNQQRPLTAAELDQKSYLEARDSSDKELLIFAARKSGRSPLKIQREFRQLARSESRLNLVEYVRNGLYHIDRFNDEERSAFISNDLHWPITHKCNDRRWAGAAEDKIVAETMLSAGDVPVPQTLAVLDTSSRLFPGKQKIQTPSELRSFLQKHTGETIFGKILNGMVSFGAFRIEQADDTHVHCAGHDPLTYQEFMQNYIGSNAYLLQKALDNHSEFSSYCSALATVRMVNMVTTERVITPLAIIKLPQGDNIADAFWRPGNLACEVDIETGCIRTIAQRGVETEFLRDHPSKDGLMGLQLPHWNKLKEINDRAARIFAPIRYQSTDIAITEDGPVLVEMNYGGGFDLPQYASGRGMLTPEVRAFFKSCGVELTPPRRKGLFSRRRK